MKALRGWKEEGENGREWRRKGKTHRRKAKGPINSFLGGHVTTQEKHREGLGSLPVHAWPTGLCHSVRPEGRKTNRTLSPHEFGFKLVVSRCCRTPPPRTNSSENYTFGQRERGGEREGRAGERPMQSRKPRFARLLAVYAACAVRALRLVVTPGRRIMWRAVD